MYSTSAKFHVSNTANELGELISKCEWIVYQSRNFYNEDMKHTYSIINARIMIQIEKSVTKEKFSYKTTCNWLYFPFIYLPSDRNPSSSTNIFLTFSQIGRWRGINLTSIKESMCNIRAWVLLMINWLTHATAWDLEIKFKIQHMFTASFFYLQKAG